MEEFSQFLNSFNLKDISPVVAGVVTGLFAARVSNRKIEIENITQERAKWREKIRENAEEGSKAILNGYQYDLSIVRSKFQVLLNPIDPLDQKIIKCLEEINEDVTKQEKKFAMYVSALLKHDWERAKDEAKPWYVKGNYFFVLLIRVLVAVFVFILLVNVFVAVFPDFLKESVFGSLYYYNILEGLGGIRCVDFFIVFLLVIFIWGILLSIDWVSSCIYNCLDERKRRKYLIDIDTYINNDHEKEAKKQCCNICSCLWDQILAPLRFVCNIFKCLINKVRAMLNNRKAKT